MAGESDDPFMAQIDAFIDQAQGNANIVMQAIAEEILASLQANTPVKTGNLRANWIITTGNGVATIGGARADQSLGVITSLRAGDVFAIVNPVVYARRVNNGFVGEDSLGRHYDQKGAHMVERTLAQLSDIVSRALTRIQQEAPAT